MWEYSGLWKHQNDPACTKVQSLHNVEVDYYTEEVTTTVHRHDNNDADTYISFSSIFWMSGAPLHSVKSCLLHAISTGGALWDITRSDKTVYRYLKSERNY